VSAAALLDRLERVRQTGPGRWLARCPAHPDRSPSLSIRELEDGRVLIHDFAGCGALEVLESVGLDWDAIMPPRETREPQRSSSSRIPARDLLEIVSEEVTVVAMVAADLLARKTIGSDDWQRLALAVGRIQSVRDSLHV
jgi:hypothetical protein